MVLTTAKISIPKGVKMILNLCLQAEGKGLSVTLKILILESSRRTKNDSCTKKGIERELNWFSKDCGRNEIVGIRITLDILGYCAFLTERGYEVREKKGN